MSQKLTPTKKLEKLEEMVRERLTEINEEKAELANSLFRGHIQKNLFDEDMERLNELESAYVEVLRVAHGRS